MLALLKSVAPLLTGAALIMFGNSLLGITVPLQMVREGFTTGTIGLVMSASFVGLLAGSYYARPIIGHVGHIRTFAGVSAIAASGALLYPLAVDPVVWALLRAVSGVCIAAFSAIMESWLNERSTNATRGQVLAFYLINNYTFMTLGQLAVNVYDLGGVETFMLVAIAISLSLVPVVMTRMQQPEVENVTPMSMRELYGVSPMGFIGAFVSGSLMGSFFGMAAVFADGAGLPVFEVSLFTGGAIAGGILLQWPMGRLSDRFDRRGVMAGLLAGAAAACAGMGTLVVIKEPLPGLLVLGVFYGGCIANVYPIAVAQTFDYVMPGRYVAASSGLLVSFSVGAILGPLTASAVMAAAGPAGFPAFVAVVSVVFAAYTLYRIVQRPPVPSEAQVAVSGYGTVPPVGPGLDPRMPGGEQDDRGDVDREP